MIEKKFDIPFIADLALREKQIQQNYRPVGLAPAPRMEQERTNNITHQ